MLRILAVLVALVLAAALADAASAQTPVKRCGSISTASAGKVRVDVAEGKARPCALARRVMRTYLRRVRNPKREGSNRAVRVSGETFRCYVSRRGDSGPGWDFICSTDYSVEPTTVMGGRQV